MEPGLTLVRGNSACPPAGSKYATSASRWFRRRGRRSRWAEIYPCLARAPLGLSTLRARIPRVRSSSGCPSDRLTAQASIGRWRPRAGRQDRPFQVCPYRRRLTSISAIAGQSYLDAVFIFDWKCHGKGAGRAIAGERDRVDVLRGDITSDGHTNPQLSRNRWRDSNARSTRCCRC